MSIIIVVIEERIKELLGIPKSYKLYSLVRQEKKNKVYYQIVAYKPKQGIRRFRVKKAVEEEVLKLWQEFEKQRREKRKLKELIEKLNTEELREILEKLNLIL